MSTTHRTKAERTASNDAYYTQPGLARACIQTLVRDGWIRDATRTRMLEPSCGQFAWVKAAIQAGVPKCYIHAIDVDQFLKLPFELNGIQFMNQDFTTDHQCCAYDLICGNPPFNAIEAHLEASFEAVSETGIIAYLLPVLWFTAAGPLNQRKNRLLGAWKPSHQYLITPRPTFREKAGSDSAAYALWVWAPGMRRHSGFDILDWESERSKDREVAKIDRAVDCAMRAIVGERGDADGSISQQPATIRDDSSDERGESESAD